jgi:hypothetical protein
MDKLKIQMNHSVASFETESPRWYLCYETLAVGVYDAVLTFNEGNVGWVIVLQQLGINPGINMIYICQEINHQHIQMS